MRERENVKKVGMWDLIVNLQDNNFNRFNGSHIETILGLGDKLFKEVGVEDGLNLDEDFFDTIYLYPLEDKALSRNACEVVGWAMGADAVYWRKDQNGKSVLRCWWD